MTGQKRCYKDRWMNKLHKEEIKKKKRRKKGMKKDGQKGKKSQQRKMYQENKEPTTKHGDHFVLGNSPWRGACLECGL